MVGGNLEGFDMHTGRGQISRDARRAVTRLVLSFFLFSCLWILISDRLAEFLAPTLVEFQVFQTLKGLFFVAVVSLILCNISLSSFRRLEAAHRKTNEAHREILKRLAFAAEFRDDASGAHNTRIGALAKDVAEAMKLDPRFCERISHAAALHDVGKIAVPDCILRKPAKLTELETLEMRRHVETGWDILRGASGNEFLRMAAVIARYHHEKWDGSGYPVGLTGMEIPIEARIVAVCDVFDALVSERPYKNAWSKAEALAEIQRQSGYHFDPKVVDAFLQVVGDTEKGPVHRESQEMTGPVLRVIG